ncbi:MAG: UDP-N-acetyl-D-mannosamine dehydrogenase, partial [Arcobacter sp.]|nr:UDP-N-acetyl-D-mannosamine dehydrogenase [Arcobacter sp.]
SIAPYVKEGDIVILESTSPVGTTDKVEEVLAEMRPELFPSLNTQRLTPNTQKSKIFVAHCPERVLPGHIMRELVENDRIVGGTTPEATEVTVAFYKTFVEGEVLATDAKTAEMAKLTENSFRDTNIAFANELSILCDKFGIDVWELIRLANRHPRVNILQPGAGVGGHCIAVETFEKENGRKAKIACMGLAFKPDIDDLRESPALYITRRLIADGLDVLAVEPNIKSFNEFDIVEYQEAVEKADIVTFLVSHKEFKALEIETDLDFCGVLNK